MEPHFALCFEGRVSQELREAGVSVHMLGNVRIRNPLSVRRARRALSDLLSREPFDAVICHSAWPMAMFGPIAKSMRLRLAFWLHDVVDGKHWLHRWARKTIPDIGICTSEFAAATLSTIYPTLQAKVLYCPVAPQQEYLPRDRAAIREELKTPLDATVIIQASRMEAWKGHALHLEALGLLRDLPNWICWIVGGPQRPQEQNYVEELKLTSGRLNLSNRVRFLGQRSDVSRLLAASDIHCQPNSSSEPFGISFIEALYAGLPVVSTALGGVREIVDESCGILVPPSNSEALAASLRLLIEDQTLRHRLGAAGKDRARSLCDPNVQTNRLRDVLAHRVAIIS
jgi:glycosyltransferase involved in cell wall biosynthesis